MSSLERGRKREGSSRETSPCPHTPSCDGRDGRVTKRSQRRAEEERRKRDTGTFCTG